MTALHRVAVVTLLGVVLLGGCSGGSDETEKSPTCETALSAAEAAQRQAEVAIAAVSDDPDSSRTTLTAVRAALATASGQVSGDERAELRRAQDAVAGLITQARRSAGGRDVEGEVVTRARADLLAAVQGIRAEC